MGKNLYSFNKVNCTDSGAPRAVPQSYADVSVNGNGYINRDSLVGVQSGVINVVNHFQWTTSPPIPSLRREVPRITLREKRLKTNAILSAAAYYLMSASGTAGAAVDLFNSGALGSIAQNAASALGPTFGSIGQSIVNSPIGDILGQDIEGLGLDVLKPYEGLYITEDTKFRYVLPYFTDTQQLIRNSFDVNDAMFGPESTLGKAVGTMRGVAETMAKFMYFREPGLYIERPKFYSFNETGESLNFKFPLINTGWSTYDDVCLNWQLCFLLAYQNSANRRTRELIDPACIYEVSIPGVKYMPFAYIQNLNISYLGARRQMKINAPGAGTITTIVPDAYMVDITLQGLVADTQNFMQAAITGKQDIVSVVNTGTFNLLTEVGDLLEGNA